MDLDIVSATVELNLCFICVMIRAVINFVDIVLILNFYGGALCVRVLRVEQVGFGIGMPLLGVIGFTDKIAVHLSIAD